LKRRDGDEDSLYRDGHVFEAATQSTSSQTSTEQTTTESDES